MKISFILSLVSVLCFAKTSSVVGAVQRQQRRTGLRGVVNHHQGAQHPSVQRRAKMNKNSNNNNPNIADPTMNPAANCGPDGVCVTINSGHTSAPNTNPNHPNTPPGIENRNSADDLQGEKQPEFGTGTRSIAVSVNYVENPQDVAWSLFEVNTGKEILHSDYEEVTQPGIVTKQADGVAPGPYQLLMTNLKGQGISSGNGWVKVLDMTNSQEDGGTILFENNGRFGPMLMEEFNLY